jgi:hypothetical protein
MPRYEVLIEKIGERGGVVGRETVKVEADNEAQAKRESDFVRKMRFVGGMFEKRVTVLGVAGEAARGKRVAVQGALYV